MYAGERFFARTLQLEKGDLKTGFLTGFLSGISETTAVCPFEVVKVRLQSKAHVGKSARAACTEPRGTDGKEDSAFCFSLPSVVRSVSRKPAGKLVKLWLVRLATLQVFCIRIVLGREDIPEVSEHLPLL